jgi:hypothetical protein
MPPEGGAAFAPEKDPHVESGKPYSPPRRCVDAGAVVAIAVNSDLIFSHHRLGQQRE